MSTFRGEIEGSVMWLLQGARRAIRQGYTIPDTSRRIGEEFAQVNDPVRKFWQEECEVRLVENRGDERFKLKTQAIFRRFLRWAEDQNIDTRKWSAIRFGRDFKPIATGRRLQYDEKHGIYAGIVFKTETDSENPGR